jgi:L-amino acid N-acyltransferase YncA
MEHPFSTYLHDHLAGAGFAIELLETMVREFKDHETGIVAAEVLAEVREDKRTLETIIDRVGRSHLDLKDAAAWFAEKVSRIKLQHDDPVGIGAFEAFEALGLGIMGKCALWRALSRIAPGDARLSGYYFEDLGRRAQAQFDKVDDYRLRLAPAALNGHAGEHE